MIPSRTSSTSGAAAFGGLFPSSHSGSGVSFHPSSSVSNTEEQHQQQSFLGMMSSRPPSPAAVDPMFLSAAPPQSSATVIEVGLRQLQESQTAGFTQVTDALKGLTAAYERQTDVLKCVLTTMTTTAIAAPRPRAKKEEPTAMEIDPAPKEKKTKKPKTEEEKAAKKKKKREEPPATEDEPSAKKPKLPVPQAAQTLRNELSPFAAAATKHNAFDSDSE